MHGSEPEGEANRKFIVEESRSPIAIIANATLQGVPQKPAGDASPMFNPGEKTGIATLGNGDPAGVTAQSSGQFPSSAVLSDESASPHDRDKSEGHVQTGSASNPNSSTEDLISNLRSTVAKLESNNFELCQYIAVMRQGAGPENDERHYIGKIRELEYKIREWSMTYTPTNPPNHLDFHRYYGYFRDSLRSVTNDPATLERHTDMTSKLFKDLRRRMHWYRYLLCTAIIGPIFSGFAFGLDGSFARLLNRVEDHILRDGESHPAQKIDW
jgi:hypothetical protein